jgi:hypothetical protein
MRAVQTTAAFVRHQFTGRAMPEMTWKHDDAAGQMRLTVSANPAPKEVRFWRCTAPNKDIREARWESRVLEVKDGRAEVSERKPEKGVVSFYADCSFDIDGLGYSLCTQLRMAEAAN